MKSKDKLLIFVSSLIISFIFWRLWLFVFYDEGEVSFLRGITGLNIHHYHYGMLFVLIALFLFMFHKINKYSVALAGFGFGSFFDGFISRLVGSSVRKIEIANYNQAFSSTILLFLIIILLSVVFYFWNERILKNNVCDKTRKLKVLNKKSKS